MSKNGWHGISGAHYRFICISEGLAFLKLAKLLQNALHIVRGVVWYEREVDYLRVLIDQFPIQASCNKYPNIDIPLIASQTYLPLFFRAFFT